jgi:UPF0755 protein
MKKTIIGIIAVCVLIGFTHVRGEIYTRVAREADQVSFTIEPGESVAAVAERLESEQIIRSSFWFKKYLSSKKLDRNVRAGNFVVDAPITLQRVAEALSNPSQNEREVTLIPGWTLGDIAAYFEREGIATEAEVLALTGTPATNTNPSIDSASKILGALPSGVSIEGYLRPDTYRIFVDSTIASILEKLLLARDAEFTTQILADINKSGRTVHEVLTIASLLEKEVRGATNKALAADLFWRRYDSGWAMQADSSIHYIHGTNGSVFTTKDMRESLNPYNTYKYAGLPPGPIGTPSIMAIEAAVYPEPNEFWYFITTLDTGEAKFARSLDEHNVNVQKYLR